MRLPGVSFFFAVSLLSGAPEARVNEGPDVAVGCVERAGAEAPPAPAPPEAARPAPVPTPLDARGLALAEKTYADVFLILSGESRCSSFFGGSAVAVEAFNQFVRRLSVGPLDNRKVAIRMSGTYAFYQSNATGATYRLFDEATLNLDGPLGPRAPRSTATRLAVGRYPSHTPQARALILLHELGHLVQRPGGGWLLPNDGYDHALSERNTREVEAHCVEQLRGLRD